MKVVERIFEHRIRQQIKIDDMQFGFMKDTIRDAIFNVRSKADISQLNLPRGNRQLKKCKNRKTKK